MALPIVPGMRFGRLTVIGPAEPSPAGNIRVECRCDCGEITQPHASSLRNGKTKSCGCLQKEIARERNIKDITRQKFGHLTALHPTGRNHREEIVWRLRCDCGNETLSTVKDLTNQHTRSCGCLKRDQLAQRSYRHGGATGGKLSSLYICWRSIKQRCFDPNHIAFKNYGGRGITMYPKWIDDYIPFRDYVNKHLGPPRTHARPQKQRWQLCTGQPSLGNAARASPKQTLADHYRDS